MDVTPGKRAATREKTITAIIFSKYPVFLFDEPFPRGHALSIFNRLEQLAASLRRNICCKGGEYAYATSEKSGWMSYSLPESGNRWCTRILVGVRETSLEIGFNAGGLSDLIQKGKMRRRNCAESGWSVGGLAFSRVARLRHRHSAIRMEGTNSPVFRLTLPMSVRLEQDCWFSLSQ